MSRDEAHPFSYPRSARLLKRVAYQECYAQGRKYHTRHFLVFVWDRRDLAQLRTGIAVSKKVGNAVFRNRCKRVLREFFRRKLHVACQSLSFDIVVVVKKQAGITLNLRLAQDELCPLFEHIVQSSGRVQKITFSSSVG